MEKTYPKLYSSLLNLNSTILYSLRNYRNQSITIRFCARVAGYGFPKTEAMQHSVFI